MAVQHEGETVGDMVIEQWVPFAALVAIVGISFLGNVAVSRKVSDSMNGAVFEFNTPWKRPALLSGKRLVMLWFLAAVLYAASLPGAIEVSFFVWEVSTLPALFILLLMTAAAVSYKRSLAQQADTQLDERERGVRNMLYLTSYRVVASILVLTWIAAFLVLMVGEFDLALLQLPRDTALGLAFAWAMFLWVLPSLVHAWVDPVPDDGSDEERGTAWSAAKREIKKELKRELAELRGDLAQERIHSPKAEKALRTAEAELRKAERYLADATPTKRRKHK
ncbi:MAG: hypothetical protein ACKOGF_05110 [Candidatus Limnocylindrus sp.]